MGFSEVHAALLDCAGRSVQIITLLIAGIISTKFKNCRVIVVTAGNLICVLGSALMAFLPFKQTWPRLVSHLLFLLASSTRQRLTLAVLCRRSRSASGSSTPSRSASPSAWS